MALQLKNRVVSLCSRALRIGVVAGVGVLLASCSAKQVAWHSPGEASRLDTSPQVVFDGEPVLAARGDNEPQVAAWRDDSLNIREIKSQWEDEMWPERHRHRGRYHRFSLPRNADTYLYYEDSYTSSSTYYRSYNNSYGSSYRGW